MNVPPPPPGPPTANAIKVHESHEPMLLMEELQLKLKSKHLNVDLESESAGSTVEPLLLDTNANGESVMHPERITQSNTNAVHYRFDTPMTGAQTETQLLHKNLVHEITSHGTMAVQHEMTSQHEITSNHETTTSHGTITTQGTTAAYGAIDGIQESSEKDDVEQIGALQEIIEKKNGELKNMRDMCNKLKMENEQLMLGTKEVQGKCEGLQKDVDRMRLEKKVALGIVIELVGQIKMETILKKGSTCEETLESILACTNIGRKSIVARRESKAILLQRALDGKSFARNHQNSSVGKHTFGNTPRMT